MATTINGALLSSASLQAAVVNQWVQFAPNDMVDIREIENVPANGRPAATLDGQPLTLTQRGTVTTAAQAPATHFQVLMCEAQVSAFGHSGATVGAVSLKMPVANLKRREAEFETDQYAAAQAAKTACPWACPVVTYCRRGSTLLARTSE